MTEEKEELETSEMVTTSGDPGETRRVAILSQLGLVSTLEDILDVNVLSSRVPGRIEHRSNVTDKVSHPSIRSSSFFV